MTTKKVVLTLLLVFLSAALVSGAPKKEDGILVLDEENIQKTIDSIEHMLILFYNRNDAQSMQFESGYKEIQDQLNQNNVPIALGKIDVAYKDYIMEAFYINSAPQVVFLTKKRHPLPYDGQLLNEDIFYWLQIQLQPVSNEVTCDQITNQENPLNRVMIYYGDIDHDDYKRTFTDVAYHAVASRRYSFLHMNDQACAFKLGAKTSPSIILMRNLVDPKPAIWDKSEWHPIKVIEWAWTQITPNVIEFTQDNYELAYYQDIPQIFLFRVPDPVDKDDFELAFEEVAAKNRGEYLFITCGVKGELQKKISEVMGVQYKDLPTIRILDQGAGLKYKYPGDISSLTRKKLQGFLDDYEDLQLDSYYKSAKPPVRQRNAIAVVGDTQKEIIHNKSKDVFVLYYAPWNEECKKPLEQFEELAKSLKSISDLVIATFDISKNDPHNVANDNLPIFIFYAQEEETGKSKYKKGGINFKGERSVKSYEEFIKQMSVAYQADRGLEIKSPQKQEEERQAAIKAAQEQAEKEQKEKAEAYEQEQAQKEAQQKEEPKKDL